MVLALGFCLGFWAYVLGFWVLGFGLGFWELGLVVLVFRVLDVGSSVLLRVMDRVRVLG